MTRQAPARAERRSRPKCSECGATMKLFGIEAHPTIDRTDLLTYVCSHCDGLETETVPHAKSKRLPKKGTVMPMSLLANNAYALLGTSRQLVVGPDTATGLISALTVGAVATQGTADFNGEMLPWP